MKYLLTVVLAAAVLALGAVLYTWSGLYNIAATEPHWDVTSSFIRMLRNRSIAAHSDAADMPDFQGTDTRQAAFSHYDAMCRLCHGAPGASSLEFSQGLYPAPPGLTSEAVQEALSDAELYWIVKHGIKMTGMPAFGPTHDERDLRALVALVREMPGMSAEQYERQAKQTDHAHHAHGSDEGESRPAGDGGTASSPSDRREDHGEEDHQH